MPKCVGQSISPATQHSGLQFIQKCNNEICGAQRLFTPSEAASAADQTLTRMINIHRISDNNH